MTTLPLRSDSAALVIHSLLRHAGPFETGLHPGRTLDALDLYLKDQNIRHFSAWEVVQLSTYKGVTNTVPAPHLWGNIVPTIHVCEWLRSELGDRPINVLSGYRSASYNRAVGGSTNSLHKKFNALDIYSHHATPRAIEARLRGHTDWDNISCGTYVDDGFCHIDTRPLLGMDPWRAVVRDRAA